MEESGRRRFLKSAAALGAASPAGAASQPNSTQSKPTPAHPHAGSLDHDKIHAQHAQAGSARAYMFLSRAEVAFLDAAVARWAP